MFVVAQVLTLVVAFGFCVVGTSLSVVRRRRDRQRIVAYDLAATMALTDDEAELELVTSALIELPDAVLADVLQELAGDIEGEGQRRVRLAADASGLTGRIRRWSRSRRWRRRLRAAHLAVLLPAGARERAALIRDPNAIVQARAIESLDGEELARFANALLDAFDHESPTVRGAAQYALSSGGAASIGPILRILTRLDRRGVDGRTFVLVAEVAAHLPDARLVELLLRFVTHEDPSLRRLVAACLGSGTIADPEIHLAALLCDPVDAVRAEAAHAIGRAGADGLAHLLGDALSDPSWIVRRNAGAALAGLGPMGIVVLRCHRFDDDRFARDMALHALGGPDRNDVVRASLAAS